VWWYDWLMDDTIRDAEWVKLKCPVCDHGVVNEKFATYGGYVQFPMTCKQCKGEGYILHPVVIQNKCCPGCGCVEGK